MLEQQRPAWPDQWSRSRFWLCHFLHNRHIRRKVDWSAPLLPHARLAPEAIFGLQQRLHAPHQGLADLIEQAPHVYQRDPAFVQVLRLYLRERQWQEQLLEKVASRHSSDAAFTPRATRRKRVTACVLGMRYFMASLLLDDILETVLLQHVIARLQDRPTAAALEQLLSDKQAHIAFLMEYLTLAYAEFNFVRRNLRRARLRGLFRIHLRRLLSREKPLLAAAAVSLHPFKRACTHAFEQTLEIIVPYKRDALLRTLAMQQDAPFGRALHHRLH